MTTVKELIPNFTYTKIKNTGSWKLAKRGTWQSTELEKIFAACVVDQEDIQKGKTKQLNINSQMKHKLVFHQRKYKVGTDMLNFTNNQNFINNQMKKV